MKQKFYNQFQLFTGLSKMRNCEHYNKREEIFKNFETNGDIMENKQFTAFNNFSFEN